MNFEGKSEHLQEVVECLLQQENSVSLHVKPSESITHIYESTKNLLGELDDHVTRCKKYNQAKIHRKYQIVINDLTQQNIKLKAKVNQELHARPSSQKYVSDLIDKMIELRSANQQLKTENQHLSHLVRQFEERGDVVIEKRNIKNEENPESRQISRRQWEKIALKQVTSKFLVKKKFQTLNQHIQESSNFQRFLIFNKNKIDKWYLIDFFERIDKWTSHLKDVRFLDRSRLINKIENSLEKNQNSPSSPDTLLPAFSTLQRSTINRTLIENTLQRKAKINSKLKSKNKQSISFRLRSIYQSQKKMDATLQ